MTDQNKPWWSGFFILSMDNKPDENGKLSSLILRVFGANDSHFFCQPAVSETQAIATLPVWPVPVNSLKINMKAKTGNVLFASFSAAEKFAASMGAPAAVLPAKAAA